MVAHKKSTVSFVHWFFLCYSLLRLGHSLLYAQRTKIVQKVYRISLVGLQCIEDVQDFPCRSVRLAASFLQFQLQKKLNTNKTIDCRHAYILLCTCSVCNVSYGLFASSEIEIIVIKGIVERNTASQGQRCNCQSFGELIVPNPDAQHLVVMHSLPLFQYAQIEYMYSVVIGKIRKNFLGKLNTEVVL